jgi:hypothetical protein
MRSFGGFTDICALAYCVCDVLCDYLTMKWCQMLARQEHRSYAKACAGEVRQMANSLFFGQRYTKDVVSTWTLPISWLWETRDKVRPLLIGLLSI